MFKQNLGLTANLGATLIRKDGTHRDIPSLSNTSIDYRTFNTKMKDTMGFWTRLWTEAKEKHVITAAVTLAAFIASIQAGDASPI